MCCLRRVVAPALLAGVLTACSESGAAPPRMEPPSQQCRAAERSLYAEDGPAKTLRGAMRPYLEPGEPLTILERFSDTAIVLVERRRSTTRAELVRVQGGWVRTSVVRCR